MATVIQPIHDEHISEHVTPAEPEGAREHPMVKMVAGYLALSERVVLILIAIVLVILAVLLLISTVAAMVQSVMNGSTRDVAIEILDSVLLVMMTMEIVYTVTLSLESHKLSAEPFLIIGVIAAIRRMLVITAESTKIENNVDLFRSTLLELGLLAVIVIALAAAMFMIRRSQKFGSDI